MINKFLYPNGGSETYMFKLGDFLKAHGHEVQYFGMDHEGRCVGNRVNAYTSDMNFHGGAKLSKLVYALKTIYSVEARKKLRLVLENFRPDAVHLNNFNYQLTPSVILEIHEWRRKSRQKCPIVYTAHDYQLICPNHMCRNPITGENCEKCLTGAFYNCVKGKCIHKSMAKSAVGMAEAYFWKRKGTYRYIDSIICCSEFLKRKMDRNPILAARTILLPHFSDTTGEKKAREGEYVLYFGRYSEEKGIRTLTRACRELPDIPFVFAGSGPLDELLKDISNIKDIGFQTDKMLKQIIRKAQFVILPSEWYEAFGLSAMEAVSLGTPVLGANIGGIPEVVRNGFTGELFESGDIEDMRKHIQSLWKDRRKVAAYSQNCSKIHFMTVEEYYQKITRIYQGG